MMNLKSILQNVWVQLTAILGSVLFFIQIILLRKIRLNGQDSTTMLDLIRKESCHLVLEEEFSRKSLPSVYRAVGVLRWIPFLFHIEERVLQAGFAATDRISWITFPRGFTKRFLSFLGTPVEEKTSIFIMQEWDAEAVGEITIKNEPPQKPLLPHTDFVEIDTEIKNVIDKRRNKLGVLLYGPAGNGKSFLVRYFAEYYKLPVYITTFDPKMTNHAIIRMFSKIKSPAIVLLEDFDNHFNLRKTRKNSSYSFDAILNVLDGLYSSMDGIITFMTANYLNKIDPALRCRPSRFRIVKHIENPSLEVLHEIYSRYQLQINEEEFVSRVTNKSLDVVLNIVDQLRGGTNLDDAIVNASQFNNIESSDSEPEEEEEEELEPSPVVPIGG